MWDQVSIMRPQADVAAPQWDSPFFPWVYWGCILSDAKEVEECNDHQIHNCTEMSAPPIFLSNC